MNLNGVKVLLTGGTSGIGLKTVEALVREGAKVVVVARDEAKLERLHQTHVLAGAYACDLAQPAEVLKIGVELGRVHPDLMVLINNAAIQHNILFDSEHSTPESIEYEMRTNFLAPLLLTRALLPTLKQQQEAAIINITSGLALVPKRSAAVYCGTKGGLRIFTQALRNQLQGSRIRVIEVLPPVVDTPMTAGRGRLKLSPERVADATVGALRGRLDEVHVEKTKILHWLSRVSPTAARSLMKRMG